MFFDEDFSESLEFCCQERELYPSFTDFVEARNILIQEGHLHCGNCITVEMPRRMQKVET